MSKYLVGKKEFRFLCDAQEWSWQLCRKYVTEQDNPEDYRIRDADDRSSGVMRKGTTTFLYIAKVKILV